MGVSVYVVLEREVPEFDTFVSGKALLAAVCNWNIPELMRLWEFDSATPQAVAEMMGYYLPDDPDAADYDDSDLKPLPAHITLPPEKWFDPALGLTAVRDAIHILRQPTFVVPVSDSITATPLDWVLGDLEDIEQVLVKAEQAQTRFHFEVS